MKRRLLSLFVLMAIVFVPAVGAQEVSFEQISVIRESDFTIPMISTVAIIPSSNAMHIEWETDMPANSFIEYGETPAYGIRVDASTKGTRQHKVDIERLSAFQTYHFRIRVSREGSVHELFSRPLTFTTLPAEASTAEPLYPTPFDFSAPQIRLFSVDYRDSRTNVTLETGEAATMRFEYGPYVKGASFVFEEKKSQDERVERISFDLSGITPGSFYLYRLTTQDRFGNRAVFYGNFETTQAQRQSEQPLSSSPQNPVPPNSVLITSPSQLAGIPKGDIVKDEKSGRLYRIFRTTPPGSVLLTHPSQLTGLTTFQIWKDEKSGRLYRHPGIPNPESKAVPRNKEGDKSKETNKSNEPPKNNAGMILITHPLQLKVLFPYEVWRDTKTGRMYRIIPRQISGASVPAQPSVSSQKSEEPYIPFYR